jgi:CRP/FNR family transcriptional regulator, cyclic AMP receptor protein
MLAACQREIIGNCHRRVYRLRRKSGNLSSEFFNRLAALAIPAYHPKGTVLFVEGEPSRGVFILCSGRVKLFMSSANGKTVILRFAHPGEILGLAGTLSGQPYEAWGEATEPTQTSFVERKRFVDTMRRHGELAMQVDMQLGEFYCSAIGGVRVMGLSRSAGQKLALSFSIGARAIGRSMMRPARGSLSLMRKSLRSLAYPEKTVTRVLSGFKKKGLIQWKGGGLVLWTEPHWRVRRQLMCSR